MAAENPALKDQFARYLGIEVVSLKDDHAKVRLVVRPEFLNGAGLAHGGVIFSLADYAFALAANSGEAPGLGINAGIQFTRAGQPGDELFAEAELVSKSKKLGTYRIVVTNQDGAVLASAQAMAYFK